MANVLDVTGLGQDMATKKTDEKEVYLPTDIMEMLGLSRAKTYAYLAEVYDKQSPFRVIKVGRLVRVPKKNFDDWLFQGKETTC